MGTSSMVPILIIEAKSLSFIKNKKPNQLLVYLKTEPVYLKTESVYLKTE